jgi:hypothetical protein
MAGRGSQTFKKRQKEQQRKEKAEEKLTKRLQRKEGGPEEPSIDGPLDYSDDGITGSVSDALAKLGLLDRLTGGN